MKIQKTNNIKEHRFNICITGSAGSGKTHLASTIKGKVFFISCDKGQLTLKDVPIDFVKVNNWGELIEVMKFITSSAFRKHGYDWVVFDTITEAARILKKHLDEKGVKGFDYWNEYEKHVGGIMTTLRDNDNFNSLQIFEIMEKENVNGIFEKRCSLQGSLASRVPHFYDFVFVSKRIDSKEKTQYVLQTCHKNGFDFCKTRGVKLDDYIPANISYVLKKLRG